MNMIGVLVVDDHRMSAQSLARLFALEPDMEVVGTAFSAAEALSTIAEVAPDVCVLDYQLPDMDGASLVAELRKVAPTVRVLLLTGVNRPSTAQAAMSVGCDAYITKDRAAGELVEIIRSLHAGGHTIERDVASAFRTTNETVSNFRLTPRELEILALLAKGASTTEVAEASHISNNTVRTHVQRIISKLGAHSKLEAVAIARNHNLI